MNRLFRVPVLSRRRIVMAFAVALAADAFQLALLPLGPLSWGFFDEVIDVLAMVTTTLLLGFHPLLLPTFIIELIPIADMLPTWTGCVGAVVFLRKGLQKKPPVIPTPNQSADVIDV